VLDEDTDPDLHHTVYLLGDNTLLSLHQHTAPRHRRGLQRVPGRPGPRRLRVADRSSWRSGPAAWTSWASPTAASRTPATGRA
jgi:hypothetical protein